MNTNRFRVVPWLTALAVLAMFLALIKFAPEQTTEQPSSTKEMTNDRK